MLQVLLVIILVCSTFADDKEFEEQWTNFKRTHNKAYGNDEIEHARYKQWLVNHLSIEKHNEDALHSFTLGMNQFGDQSNRDFNAKARMMKSLKRGKVVSTVQELGLSEDQAHALPDFVDWSAKGFVSEVQDQGACSSAYAFAGLGAVEGQFFNKTGKLITLSAQNIVDCAGLMLGGGCNGGILDNTLDYIMAFKGVNSLLDYRYMGQLQQCSFNQSKAVSSIGGYIILAGLNETLLKVAIATVGPVAVSMDASSSYFRYYRRGVLVDPKCSSNWEDQNHSVLIVGYGSDEYGTDYWIAKNSWGTQWGVEGYAYLARNHDNMCGLSIHPVYPDVLL